MIADSGIPTALIIGATSLAGITLTAVTSVASQLYLRKHLGKTNGQGPVAEMMEKEIIINTAHRAEDRIMFGMIFHELGIDLPALPPLGEEVEVHDDHQPEDHGLHRKGRSHSR